MNALATSVSRRLAAVDHKFERIPRFGHSRDFADLFSNDQEVVINYITGILVVSLMILSVFLFWFLMLISFKLCCGPRRVGFLSGAPFQATTVEGKANPWIDRGRAAFAVACIFFLVFSIVLATAGIGNLTSVTNTIGDGALSGYQYFASGQAHLTYVIAAADLLNQVKNELLADLKEYLEALQLAREAYQRNGDLISALEILAQSFDDMGNFLTDPLKQIDSTLASGQQTCENVYTVTEELDLTWLQVGVGVPLALFPTLLLAYLYWNMYGTQQQTSTSCLVCFRSWILWPLFVFLVIGCIIFCCVISILGLMNADFCTGGPNRTPEATILQILKEQGADPNSFEFGAIAYVISGCDFSELAQGDPLGHVEELKSQLNATITELQSTIDDLITTGLEMLSNETGRNATAFTNRLQEFRGPLRDLFHLMVEFLESLVCQPLHSLYYTVINRATCTDSYTVVAAVGDKQREDLVVTETQPSKSGDVDNQFLLNSVDATKVVEVSELSKGEEGPEPSVSQFEDEPDAIVDWREHSNHLVKACLSADESYELTENPSETMLSLDQRITMPDEPQESARKMGQTRVVLRSSVSREWSGQTGPVLELQPKHEIHPSWNAWISPTASTKST